MTTETIATSDSSANYDQYIEQVYETHYARLRHYFLRQFGSTSEADVCVEETICRFFVFMKNRRWEEEVEYLPVYLMRIASTLCLAKLEEKKSQCADRLEGNEKKSPFDKIRAEAIQACKERIQFKQFILRPKNCQ
jgi:DNA-directed RNA polymerase specialized sigma24 family protein